MKPTVFDNLKRDPVLCISGALAVVSAFFVPPDILYAGYIDVRTLSLLFSLMAVVGSFAQRGVLDALAGLFIRKARSWRSLGLQLVLMCYLSSMLITNDVALITFVPLTLYLMRDDSHAMLVTVILQTVAANLGSMLTPFGNPQNLYLFTNYNMTGRDFIHAVVPSGLLALPILFLLVRFLPRKSLPVRYRLCETAVRMSANTMVLGALFFVSVLAVLRIIPWYITTAVTVVVLLVMDRDALLKVDFALLLTFCFFFIFVGNIARIEIIQSLVNKLVEDREILASALVSQIVSNVPAALMLSEFTDNGKALITGTNVGGLGTLIASMASLISFKLYARAQGARPAKFMIWFSSINFMLLVLFLAFVLMIY